MTVPAHIQDLITDLGLQGDRVAIEHNGNIVPRTEWANTGLQDGDRLEIVHFVGGGSRLMGRRRVLYCGTGAGLSASNCR